MLTRLQIDRIEPFADGDGFWDGRFLRPPGGYRLWRAGSSTSRNAVIVNIDKAPAMPAAMSSMIRMSTSCGPQT